MDKMKIEIWSDIACPYCYIGKRKLESALSQFPHADKVELVWHSYELNPTLSKKALTESFYTYFANGHDISEGEAMVDLAKIAELAETVGLHYNFDRLVVANTSDGLRLVKLAKKEGLATDMEEELFRAYFTDGLDISSRDVLVELGEKVGLAKFDIVSMLDSDRFLSEIKEDIDYSENKLDLEYIPFYLFNNKHIVQGSISPQDYLEILIKSYAEWEEGGIATDRGEVISGQSCSIDGHCS